MFVGTLQVSSEALWHTNTSLFIIVHSCLSDQSCIFGIWCHSLIIWWYNIVDSVCFLCVNQMVV